MDEGRSRFWAVFRRRTPRAGGGGASASRRAAAPRWARLQEKITAGLLFGLIGMMTGIAGLVVSYRNSAAESAVLLSAYPTASATDLTYAGFAVRVQLVNQSLRPLIVRQATLWDGDEQISDANGYLTDVGALDRSNLDPTALTESRIEFPISLNAREGRTVIILMDVWKPIVSADTPGHAVVARSQLNSLLSSLGSPSTTDGARRIGLGLELAPGGFHRYPIQGVTPGGVSSEAINQASAIQRQVPVDNWLVQRVASRGRFLGLMLRRRFAGSGQIDLVRLDVWKERSLYHRSLTRPVVAQQSQLFPLPHLPVGEYAATFELDGHVVAYAPFALPWRRSSCRGLSGGSTGRLAPAWCPPSGA
jgi:hypothetical protein